MNLENKQDITTIGEMLDRVKKVFFYRICGTGMGAAATLFKEKGIYVEGGDIKFYPPMGDYLKKSNIPCHELKNITPEFLKSFDLIVVGNVVGKNSSDARMIEDVGVPFVSFPAALGAFILNDLNVVGIAGTHGKTTTTYLFMQVFEKLGFAPGYFIGGVLDDRPSSRIGDGSYFFIEADEYDSAYFEKISKFRLYQLKNIVLTSLEFDHADIFKDVEAIKNEFRAIFDKVNKHFIVSCDYQATQELLSEFNLLSSDRVMTYGEHRGVIPKIVSSGSWGTKFLLDIQGSSVSFETNLIGMHNILNLTSVILFAVMENIDLKNIQDSVKNLKMVKRRQELKGKYKGMDVIDDFAHHPRAVKLTIDAIKCRYDKKEIIVVIEPNSATARSAIFQTEFRESLEGADVVIVAKPQTSTTIKEVGDLDSYRIAKELNEKNIKAFVVENRDSLLLKIDEVASQDRVLLVLSNGTCLGLWESNFCSF